MRCLVQVFQLFFKCSCLWHSKAFYSARAILLYFQKWNVMATYLQLRDPLSMRYWRAANPGPVFCLLLGVSSDCARPITGQITSVTWPMIG